MKIQIASDLHLEFGSRPLRKADITGDMLVLAGDVGTGPMTVRDSLASLGDKTILYVLGNHEFFKMYWDTAVDEYREALAPLRNVHFLEQESIILDGIRFVGTTLWTDFLSGAHGPASERELPDFTSIWKRKGERDFFYIDIAWPEVAERFQKSLSWLRKELKTPFSGPTVVITHHAPSRRSNPPRFADSPISGAFYTHLDDLIEETQPVLWIHGHMHDSSDYRIGRTRVVCNPYGIAWEEINPTWNPETIVEI